MPDNLRRAMSNAQISLDSAEKYDSELQELQLIDVSNPLDTISYKLFNELSHSNERLRSLTAEVLGSWPEYEEDHEWKDIADFPEPISRWFRGQKYIVFRDMAHSSLTDIMAALRRYMSNEHQQIATEEMSMKCLIQQTILKQKQFLDSGDSHSMSGLSGRQDLWHSGLGQSLATCCKCVVGLFATTLRRNGLSIGLVTTSLVI